eukprot:TRINITY_DN2689_c0_g1_i1.p1 TRINITY_DN2689_c0_g1~~TRINITY_DN2689_c0_g1_i1.p1  ORF type:complete len:351 (-),score=111.37 TRINITY_DN2689_c0_g1_i1:136-1059(-)
MEGKKEVFICDTKFEIGPADHQVGFLDDSSHLLQDPPSLIKKLNEDGYLFIRKAIPKDVMKQGRTAVGEQLLAKEMIEPTEDFEKLKIKPSKNHLSGVQELCKTERIKRVLEGIELENIFKTLFGDEVLTYSFKWMRAVPTNDWTGCHMDVVYMGRGTQKVLTCWVPFTDVPLEKGPLAVCRGTHSLPAFQKIRETYGKLDVDRDYVSGTGWFTNDPSEISKHGGKWLTANFEAGDIVLFTLYTFHASLKNVSDEYRVTCDIRWQLKNESADPRWMGEKPIGHTKFGMGDEKDISMEEAKKVWGLNE